MWFGIRKNTTSNLFDIGCRITQLFGQGNPTTNSYDIGFSKKILQRITLEVVKLPTEFEQILNDKSKCKHTNRNTYI